MPRVIIAGCGYVGLAAARLFQADGWDVLGITHRPESAAHLEKEYGLRGVALDLGEKRDVAQLSSERGADLLVHCASSGRGGVDAYERVYVRGLENLLEVLSPARAIFTSSTSVYAQTDGSLVTEESAAEPSRETGRKLIEAEGVALQHGGCAMRVAGIYGPTRSILLRKFFGGEAVIEGDGSRLINQVHRDDVASAIRRLAESAAPGVYNVSDDFAIPQAEVYRWLAEHFGRPSPPFGPIDVNRKRGWTSKAVSNHKLRSLGWAPRFPSFKDAVLCDGDLVRLALEEAG